MKPPSPLESQRRVMIIPSLAHPFEIRHATYPPHGASHGVRGVFDTGQLDDAGYFGMRRTRGREFRGGIRMPRKVSG